MKSRVLEQLGKNIKRLRTQNGYSQEEFAEKIGIATNTLSSIERGFAFMTVTTLEKISDILNVQPYELFYSTNENQIDMYEYILRILKKIKHDNYKLNTLYKIVKSLFG